MHLFHFIKRFSAVILTLLLTAVFLGRMSVTVKAYTFTPDITLHSSAAILYCRDTDQILYEKNADQQQMPGHLAQIMTAVVVLEACSDLDGTTITADDSLYNVLYQYSEPDDLRYADIFKGDTLTVREYLYAMMLTSSCESALILADHFGDGNAQNFVAKMNDKAKALGCTGTTFTNPTGLADAQQQTTARDMLTITNYALSLKDFEKISTTVSYTPKSSNPENHPDAAAWVWTHSNAMMLEDSDYYYEGAKGIKTGNLESAGRSIITEATNDGNTYLVVLMNAPFQDENNKLQYYHLDDATALLNWAFRSFTYTPLLEGDEEIGEVEVTNSDGNSYVLVQPKTDCVLLWCKDVDTTAIQKVIHLDKNVQAPVKAGQELGTMELKFSGEVIAVIPLVAVNQVDRSFTKYNLYALENFPHSPWFRYGLIGGFVCTALYILLCIYASYRAKRSVIPEDPIHLIPHAKDIDDLPRQNWKYSDSVFYHGPDRHSSEQTDKKPEQEKETVGSGKK